MALLRLASLNPFAGIFCEYTVDLLDEETSTSGRGKSLVSRGLSAGAPSMAASLPPSHTVA